MKITFSDNISDFDKAKTIDGNEWSGTGSFYRKDSQPGTIQWAIPTVGKGTWMWFVCPCGCGETYPLPITTEPNGYGWFWNGDEKLPTLSPSILKTGACKWHGWLQNGEWRAA